MAAPDKSRFLQGITIRNFKCFEAMRLASRMAVVILFLAGLTGALPAVAQPTGPTWQWVAAGGSTAYDQAEAIAVDAAGNTYVVGEALGPLQIGGATLPNQGRDDIFIAKYDPTGALLWLRGGGSPQRDDVTGLAVDAAGNCYVSATLRGASVLDGQPIGAGGIQAVVVAYDPAGTRRWLYTSGGSQIAAASGLALDGAGNAYVVGGFIGQLTVGTTTLRDTNGLSFVASFDPTGGVRWARQFGGTTGGDAPAAIGVSATGDYYVGGQLDSAVTIGSTTLHSSGTTDGYLAKFNAAGAVQWATAFGGADGRTNLAKMVVSPNGDSYLTGDFDAATLTFGATQLTRSPTGNSFGYTVRYTSAGAARWALAASSNQDAGTYGIALAGNAVHLTGGFSGIASFGASSLTARGAADLFVLACDTAGQVLTLAQAGGTNPANDITLGYAIAVDALGNRRVAGVISGITAGGQAQFGSLPIVTAQGDADFFVASLSAGPLALPSALAEADFRVFPNPATPRDRLTVSGLLDGPVSLTLLDVLGRPVQTTTGVSAAGVAAFFPRVPAGLYTLRAEQAGRARTRRVLVR